MRTWEESRRLYKSEGWYIIIFYHLLWTCCHSSSNKSSNKMANHFRWWTTMSGSNGFNHPKWFEHVPVWLVTLAPPGLLAHRFVVFVLPLARETSKAQPAIFNKSCTQDRACEGQETRWKSQMFHVQYFNYTILHLDRKLILKSIDTCVIQLC